MRVELGVSGVVQGVGFRPFIYRIARENSLTGYVRNRGDAVVEIVLEGEEEDVDRFIRLLRLEKPPQAVIDEVDVKKAGGEEGLTGFRILPSLWEARLSGSTIPPDIAICGDCLSELRSEGDRRHRYFFITCTNCGPRYTIVEKLPYDRENTTMREFPMCELCRREYVSPSARRFHAQTIACHSCGPEAHLAYNDGRRVETRHPIREAGRLLEEGSVLAIKGYGGFHLSTSTLDSSPIARIRRTKHRRQKPFAIMSRSLEATRSFAELTISEERLLASHVKPIVLLDKREDCCLSDLVAPGLHNVGVMLPYTGLHVLLFEGVSEPAFVMTSANPPGEPIVKDDDEAVKRLKDVVDYFLFHSRKIVHRCDDSVLRVHGQRQSLIRRSRGYAPAPIRLEDEAEGCVLGLGGEENVTVCLLAGGKAFLSQHVGDVRNVESLTFLRETIQHLIHLTSSSVDAVACDLHPKFATTKLAPELAAQFSCRTIRVQHHVAHVASLMAEHRLSEAVCIVCDGYGYGFGGEAWGGELFYSNNARFERLGHLQKHPLVGGDLAALHPLRMAAGMLSGTGKLEDWLTSKSGLLPHGKQEAALILEQLRRGVALQTTSCGRVLDAVSALLEICVRRTYGGEPAIKLESTAKRGRDVLRLEPVFHGKVVDTKHLIESIFDERSNSSKADLACSAESYLARSLAELAIEEASHLGVRDVGLSGGVAYNQHFVETIRKAVENAELIFHVQEQVPPGDGGLSLGQAAYASRTLKSVGGPELIY